MHILIYILFLFLFNTVVDGMDGEGRNRLYFPDYVAYNTNFDVSLITSARIDSNETVEFHILFNQNVTLNFVESRTTEKTVKLLPIPINSDDNTQSAYKVTLTNKMLGTQTGDFYQVLWNLNPGHSEKIFIKVIQLVKIKDKIIKKELFTKISGFDYNSDYSGIVNCYKPTKKPGKSGLFNQASSLDIELNEFSFKSLYLETWVKFNQSSLNFFRMMNRISGKEIFRIKLNDFNVLSFEEQNHDILFYRQNLISLKNWYHFSIIYSFNDNLISFFLNGCRFAELRTSPDLRHADLIVSFLTKKATGGFNLDKLNFYVSRDQMTLSDCYNYRTDKLTGMIPIMEVGFDFNQDLNQNNKYGKLSFNAVQLVKSEAPIFSSAPEINIKKLTNSFLIEWTSADNNEALKYSVEKSISGTNYFSVTTISSVRESDFVYSYIDSPSPDEKIVYYRIKQVNSDGSISYSSQVKIGQGIIETFDIKQNFPNPFNPNTKIIVEMFEDSYAEITVYNLEGKEIEFLHKGFLKKGEHYFPFDGSNLPSGVYLYTVSTPSFSQTKKMLLAK